MRLCYAHLWPRSPPAAAGPSRRSAGSRAVGRPCRAALLDQLARYRTFLRAAPGRLEPAIGVTKGSVHEPAGTKAERVALRVSKDHIPVGGRNVGRELFLPVDRDAQVCRRSISASNSRTVPAFRPRCMRFLTVLASGTRTNSRYVPPSAGPHCAVTTCASPPERTVIVDWNLASLGNPEKDIAFWLPSLAAERDPAPEFVAPGLDPRFAALVAGFLRGTSRPTGDPPRPPRPPCATPTVADRAPVGSTVAPTDTYRPASDLSRPPPPPRPDIAGDVSEAVRRAERAPENPTSRWTRRAPNGASRAPVRVADGGGPRSRA